MPEPAPKTLEAEIKARVSQSTKERLAAIASKRGEGVKISTIVREAVMEYLARQSATSYLRVAEGDEPPGGGSNSGGPKT